MLTVIALLDGVVEQPKLDLVVDVASALHVHTEFVDAVLQLSRNHVGWTAWDQIRANVATIPGVACSGTLRDLGVIRSWA